MVHDHVRTTIIGKKKTCVHGENVRGATLAGIRRDMVRPHARGATLADIRRTCNMLHSVTLNEILSEEYYLLEFLAVGN